jgi:hypothetical protein
MKFRETYWNHKQMKPGNRFMKKSIPLNSGTRN